MTAPSRPAPLDGLWIGRGQNVDEWLRQHKVVVSATTASIVSTFCGFPLDSLKSRLQSSRDAPSIGRLAAEVVREEGIGGLWRGFPLPLITISIVRTISFTIYTSTKRILNSVPVTSTPPPRPDQFSLNSDPQSSSSSFASSSSQSNAAALKDKQPWVDVHLDVLNHNTAADVALTSLLAGGASGSVVCVGSAPFELVKVRRQLEYQIYRDSHPELFRPPILPASAAPPTRAPPFVPPTTLQAVRLIVSASGIRGLYTGWRLHFIRDTLGTALYFAEYDVMRYYLGRRTKAKGTLLDGDVRDGSGDVQGDVPDWAKSWLPKGIIPFLCGSVAGVTSWALIYPVDTKAQQRALSGLEPRTPFVQLQRLVRGTDKDNPKPLLTGIARLYRGLGVSMARSMLTHGLLWTIVDAAGSWIETKPFERLATYENLS
ncbi:hypothetical protein CI109_103798 [Kwoniella shandongensis]|uniref:Mitochondrial carrier protein n=1 Tax=Kwoniella shandongensis TaxID=1734106 RepID=A0AAJ8LK74_9TREE